MKKNKKNLSIFKRIGLIAIALFSALGSLLLPFASNNQNNYASADNSTQDYSFSGSNIFNVVNAYNFALNNEIRKTGLYFFDFSIDFSRTGNFIYFDVSNSSFAKFDTSSLSYGFVDAFTNSSNTSKTFSYNLNTSTFSGFDGNLYTSASRFHLGIDISSPDFNANIYKIQIGSSVSNLASPSATPRYIYHNYVKYYDINDNFIYFNIGSYLLGDKQYTSTEEFMLFDNRTYYLVTDFTDDEIYDLGYNAGLLDNQQNVYDNGFSAGKIAGESIGYDKGVLDSNNYSFVSLFGAVIDTPIKAFSGLFNFEILGINLLDFFLGLLTFGVVIFVIKLILGGK